MTLLVLMEIINDEEHVSLFYIILLCFSLCLHLFLLFILNCNIIFNVESVWPNLHIIHLSLSLKNDK